eukprot:225667_1
MTNYWNQMCNNKLVEADGEIKPSKHSCDDLSSILSCIDNNIGLEYGTLNLNDPDGEVGMIHSVSCMQAGISIIDTSFLVERVCAKCILTFYTKTQFYQRIWKLKLEKRYYFHLSALMDMFGPNNNWLISKKVISTKTLFKNYYRYNCWRFVTFKSGSPIFSYYLQRYNAIMCLFYLLMNLVKTKNIKWITENKTNMKYLWKIFGMFFDKSVEKIPPFDQKFIQMYTEFIHLILSIYFKKSDVYCKSINQKIGLSYEKYMIKQWTPKRWRKEIGNYHRVCKDRYIYCGNEKCKTKSYANHKYGISPGDYIRNKRNLSVINKWYICKRCQFVYYCCRKCQKIMWKKQHR